jgi:hypothetical protein
VKVGEIHEVTLYKKWLNYLKLFEPGKKCLCFEMPTPNAKKLALSSLGSSSQLMWLSTN